MPVFFVSFIPPFSRFLPLYIVKTGKCITAVNQHYIRVELPFKNNKENMKKYIFTVDVMKFLVIKREKSILSEITYPAGRYYIDKTEHLFYKGTSINHYLDVPLWAQTWEK
ncbi:MAG: hypothetical protein CVV44_10430 [Spirochaetae bacterium HGW-Spirochaetae-1]|nr:MAG: hypothetical protein CVV44_10430 [Spirochaetae bacterium HGW-Spirochaetae-1]